MLSFLIVLILNLNAGEFDFQLRDIEYGMANRIERFDGTLYCASGNGYLGALYFYENNRWKIFNNDLFLNNSIRDLDIVENELFVSTDKGIYSIDRSKNVSDRNNNLDSQIYAFDKFRVIDFEQNEDFIAINIDANSIYLSDKNNISWNKIDIPNGYIYDMAFFDDRVLLSIDKVGLLSYSIDNSNYEIILDDLTPIYNINSNNVDFVQLNTAFENLYSVDGYLWKDFNQDFGLTSNVITKLSKIDSTFIAFDNSNVYYSSNYGKNWSQKNLKSNLKYDYLVLDFLIENNDIYLALNDIGVKKLTNFEFESEYPNIHNYEVKEIIKDNENIYYLISTIRFEHLIKKSNNNYKLILTITGDEIEDVVVRNSSLLVLSKYNGLFFSNNKGEFWEQVKLPTDFNFDATKVEYFKNKIYLFNSNLAYESLFSSDLGENWTKVSELGVVDVIDTETSNDSLFICSEDIIFKKVNDNLLNLVLNQKGIKNIYYDNGLQVFLNSGMIGKLFYNNTLGFLDKSGNVIHFINEMTFLFNDMKIKSFETDRWVDIYEFEDLSENDISTIEEIRPNYIQIGTKYLGVFDLQYSTTNVNQIFKNENIKLVDGIINEDEKFNLKIIDLNGNEILNKNSINYFDFKSLDEKIFIAVIEKNNNINILKIINN